ncbi:MAG TPA: hypothetical protein VJ952_09315 [Opitutales bacterium]|nr:hypothetical protein [Opitutales bacterium]
MTRIEYDLEQMVRQCIRWLRTVARGKPSKGKYYVKARQLVEGGTIGPAPRG